LSAEVRLSYIKCALDFPGKKANLHLPLLNIFGGCAMLGLCTFWSLVMKSKAHQDMI